MRLSTAIVALIVGLLLQAAPAAAHGKGHAGRADVAAATPEVPLGICAIDPARLEAFIAHGDRAIAHDHDAAAREHASRDHNPADHSHPFGEDSEHQLMSHGGFDMAAHAEAPAIVGEESIAQSCAAAPRAPADGIVVPPPMRPPLG